MTEQLHLQFLDSKNGQTTCSADGKYLHSSFNPQNEAQRFIDTAPCSFEPSAVILLGACLPWCADPLKKRFPKARRIAVQFDKRFSAYTEGWDDVFFVTSEYDSQAFYASLFNILGEEKLVTSLFLSWKPSETVWPDESKLAWKGLKSCMEKAQSVLTTRNHFNKVWFRNTAHNLSRIHKFAVPEKTDLPVIVTASGPSLMNALPFISKNRTKCRLLAASSSLSTLLANDIIPDFVISTDGGYYAKRHLRMYETDSRLSEVPLIISGESAVPSSLYDSVPFILLTYGDGTETVLAEQAGIPSIHGLRNGTVSGTAAAFAANLTTGAVYMCGLDLAPGKGFQHAEPNENDVPLFTGQTRIRTVETSQASSRYAAGSLALYREWFSNQGSDFTSRVFRLVSEKDNLEPLGSMKDVALETLMLNENADDNVWHFSDSITNGCSSEIERILGEAADFIENNPENDKCSLWYASLSLEKYINCLRMDAINRQKELPALAEETVSQIRSVIHHV